MHWLFLIDRKWLFLFDSTWLIQPDANIGLYGNEDYDSSYYEFTNEKTIVIEEKSFLLYGGGSIYQVFEDKSAIELARFSTDDGGIMETMIYYGRVNLLK